MSETEVWNPLDPALAECPYPRYKELRDRDPVYLEEAFGWWFVTGHAEAEQVLREPGGEMRFVEFQQLRMGRDVTDEPYCKGLQRFLPTVGIEDHKRIRATFRKHFTPGRVADMRAGIEATANSLLDAIAPNDRADLHATFSVPLPLATISALLAIPQEEYSEIERNLSHWKLAIQFPPMDGEALAKANASIAGLQRQFADIVERRRSAPGEDLLSMLVTETDAGALTEDELIANAWGLYAGGFDTTADSISASIVRLLENPDQLEALRANPELLASAVDELLRFTGPAQAQQRIFDRDVEVGGHTIPAEAPIIVYLIGANHDGRWVENADDLDVTRERPKDHLAFGGGAHKCPGRHLAGLTVEIALGAVLDRLPGLRLDGAVEWDTENMPSGTPLNLPVAWDI